MIWLLISIGVLAACWFLWRPAKPIYYRGQHQADVPHYVQSIFELLRPGAVIHVAHEGSARRLRLRKIHLRTRDRGVRLELPTLVGVDRYVEHVRENLAAASFQTSVPGPIDPLWPAQDPALLVVDELNALDAFRAFDVARAALGLDQDACYTIHMEGTPSVTAVREHLNAHDTPPAA